MNIRFRLGKFPPSSVGEMTKSLHCTSGVVESLAHVAVMRKRRPARGTLLKNVCGQGECIKSTRTEVQASGVAWVGPWGAIAVQPFQLSRSRRRESSQNSGT